MKLALLADIHSNLEALTACMEHARRHGAERFAFIGDLVGYNADPAAVVELIQREMREGDAIVVLGNHDEAAASGTDMAMNEIAARAIEWTQSQLSSDHLKFLSGLPLTQREDDMLFVHASAAAPQSWIYIFDGRRAAASIEAGAASYIFSGHVHEQVLYYLGRDGRPLAFTPASGVPIPVAPHRKWLAIVGSCGQPRDGSPAAAYALLDGDKRMLTYYRVPYDAATAAHKVRRAGLPETLARRLETGV